MASTENKLATGWATQINNAPDIDLTDATAAEAQEAMAWHRKSSHYLYVEQHLTDTVVLQREDAETLAMVIRCNRALEKVCVRIGQEVG